MPKKTRTNDHRSAHTIGRGLCVALAVCIIAVGGMAVTSFTDKMEQEEQRTAFTTAPPTLFTSASPVAVPTAPVTQTTALVTTLVTTSTAPPRTAVSPLGETVTASFSETPQYSETMDDYRAHPAVDLAGEEGDTVAAFADGTVVSVTEDVLWGGRVTVEHGALTATYCGLDVTVAEKATVSAGDPLGVLIGVPCERQSGTHLHLEFTKDGSAVDPLPILKAVWDGTDS